DGHFIDGEEVRSRMPGPREKKTHVDLVELLDGVPIAMPPSRHIGDRHRATQAADLLFSSRRGHTSLVSDWSSDVCSSDLGGVARMRRGGHRETSRLTPQDFCVSLK